MKRRIALFMAIIMVLMIIVSGCGKQADPNASASASPSDSATPSESASPSESAPAKSSVDTLTVNVGPDPDTIDPALNSSVDGATLIIHGFEGLMTLDKNGTPVPGQAASYKVSDDGKVYTFTLRDNLKWSDGKALTANDFVYSWNRAAAPATASDYGYMFEVIDGYDAVQAETAGAKLNVTAPDDKTFVVTLKNAVPYFLELTAFPTYSPVRQDIVEANGEAWATKVETYIGNGPYKMTEWVPGSHIIYTKNENYWNYANLGTQNLKFVLMDDDVAILNAFKQGEILFADSMPNDEIQAWKDKPEFNLNGQLGTYYVSYNVKKAPFDNPLVRQAFTLAIDRDWICVNIGQSGQEPAGAYVPTGLTDSDPTKEFRQVGGNYYDPTAAANDANLAKAKELLAQAGYADGKGLPAIEYLYNTGTGHQAIAEALQNMWSKLGANVTIASQEWNTFLNTRKNGDYQVARNGWLGDYNDPISFLDMWITGSGNNDAQYSNKDYDALITQAKSSSDPKVRYEAMHKAEDILFKDWVLNPIYYYVDLFLLNPKVDGFWSSPLGYKYFMYATVK